ncbi:MAG: ABC transporter permease [Myxococcaceae bacterium]|nr:ABC transporter permease [Myxococcaceae bacterium]
MNAPPIRWFDTLGGMTLMLGRSLRLAVRRPLELGSVGRQIDNLGVRSLSIATLTAGFAGLVIAIQFAFFLARFGMQHNVGRVVVLTLFRELAPVLTALTVGGRIGAGITAELGAMKVTEQIDAIRMLGAEPLKKLVYPRVVACAVVLPALTILADVTGLLAGAAVVKLDYGISVDEFMGSALDTVKLLDFTSGVMKAGVFGLIIGMVGCYKGFTVEGGSEGVGVATTQTVAITAVAICLSDFFLTKLLLAFS